jgi:hypothetical protein
MKSLAALMLTHALVAGALGVPLAQTALGIVNAFNKDDDPRGDAKARLRRTVYDLLGRQLGQIVMDGVTAPLGLSLERHVGMGGVLTDEHLMPPGFSRMYGAKNKDKIPALAYGAMGPAGGFLERVMEGRQFMQQGDYLRGVMEMLPETVGDALESGLLATRGMQDQRGHVAMRPDQVGAGAIGMKALGFTPENEHLFDEESAAKGRVEANTKLRRDFLVERFAEARAHGDDTSSILADVAKYNEMHTGPGKEGRLTMSALMQAAQKFRMEERFRQRTGSGVGYDPRRDRQLRRLTDLEG